MHDHYHKWVFRKFINTKMSEETPVRDHILIMMGLFNVLDTLGSKMDDEFKEDVIFASFPPSFSQFIMTFNMKKMKTTLPELMNQLTVAEGIIKGHKSGSINVAEGSSGFKPKGRNSKKKGKKTSGT
ncbi:hypothetical protein BVC80_1287g3 [Macleaya cordata]|uniref:Uncharacterized protein n=1 Tax=Macleaya cordata TaxID=56857 RepID=A0A200Q7Y2_MACCD|nr:hypothetical protein BVC80_1287g3 [Macleaya cordata]